MLYEYMAGDVLNIHLAISSDGKTWLDSPSNPVLAESDTTVPDSVVKQGSTYHLYYHRQENDVFWPSWHAVSTDLTNWTQRVKLLQSYSSQATFQFEDGLVRSYLWNHDGDRQYYLRYGLELGPMTEWHFDEATGIIASDSSGNRADGILVNGPTWTTGRIGAGVSFDGVDDYIATGYFANLSTWTVAVWVQSPAAPAGNPASGPVHRDANFQLNWNHPEATFRGAAGVQVGGVWYAASFGSLAANTWYHLGATYDGETLRAYRNGVLITANTAPSGPPDSESLPLEFGRHAGAPQYFRGTIDEVRIYNRALSDLEIAALGQTDLSVSAFALTPTSVVGGNPATGTVTLSGSAPTGGAVVLLTSSKRWPQGVGQEERRSK
jgi:hypothetical protein